MAERETSQSQFPRYLALGHAAYYVVTGVWPLLSIRTFEMITGPKQDRWLVHTAGVLITAIGAAVGLAGLRSKDVAQAPEIPLLAIAGAAGLAGIDVVYVARRRISPIYLADAAAELALIIAWLAAWRTQRQTEPSPDSAPA